MSDYYRLTDETMEHAGRTLYRIELTKDCKWGSEGCRGGWVESKDNLADNAWVSDNAMVYDNAMVSDNARLSDNAMVYDNAMVSDNARLSDNAMVSDNVRVFGNAMVSGDASKTPIFVGGLRYLVTITDNHLRVGCEFHTFEEWEDFKDRRIKLMDDGALEWWNTYKDILFKLIEKHKR